MNIKHTPHQLLTTGLLVLLLLLCGACKSGKKNSTYTGWKYNDQKWGGFEKFAEEEKVAPEGHLLIAGGTFTMGTTSGFDFQFSIPRRVTVSSFYLQEYEVTNKEYRQFVHWVRDSIIRLELGHVLPRDSNGVEWIDWSVPIDWSHLALQKFFTSQTPGEKRFDVSSILYNGVDIYPDTLVWKKDFPARYDEKWAKNYFSSSQYDDYPVVGVNYKQALAYCHWKTEELNKPRIKNNQLAYPALRLPTEAEWEYAALAFSGKLSSGNERITDRRLYPWNLGFFAPRKKKQQLALNCNSGGFRDARFGQVIIEFDADGHFFTAPVKAYAANGFGLYQMAGNVAEWVQDEYRYNITKFLEENISLYEHAVEVLRNEDENTSIFDRRVFLPDDIDPEEEKFWQEASRVAFENEYSRFNNADRYSVYDALRMKGISKLDQIYKLTTPYFYDSKDGQIVTKGGSWMDSPYHIQAGTRQSEHPDSARAYIGFRTAMIRLGNYGGYNNPNNNKQKSPKSKLRKKKRK